MDSFDLRNWKDFEYAGGDIHSPAWIDQVAVDSRRINSEKALFVPLEGQNYDGHQFIASAAKAGARYILASPKWQVIDLPESVTILRVENPLHAFQDIARAYRQQMPAQIIAIAGSYGKTMVKDLLYAFIKTTYPAAASPESFNSQIGVPLSLLTISRSDKFALIEMGISKTEEMDRLIAMIIPDHIILTHIGKKHLATLGDLETVATEMAKLPLSLSSESWALLPRNQFLEPALRTLKATPHFWNDYQQGLPQAITLSTEYNAQMPYCINFPDGTTYVNRTTFGFYYFLDLLNITIKAAWLLGIPAESIRKILDEYVAEPMRTEIWRSPSGTTFINDIYCSDPQSLNRSLKHLDQPHKGRKIFVFGGMRGAIKQAESDYRHIGKMLSSKRLDFLFLVGEHPFHFLIEELKKSQNIPEIILCTNHPEAIEKLHGIIEQDDLILIKGDKKESMDSLMEAFNDSICTNQCLINLAAIEANISAMRQKLSPKTRIMVMVKAGAYGTHDVRIAQFLESCSIDILGVSYVDEAVALKLAGVKQAIFVINAASYESVKIVKWGLEVGVSEKSIIASIADEASKQNKQIKVHLHIDTGMSRFGCRPEDAVDLAAYICSFSSLKLEGIMTHFACADDPEQDSFTLSQANSLEKIGKKIKELGFEIPWIHAANSAAVMRFDFPQFNMVRVGLAVYGLYPSEAAKNCLELKLALSLVSRIVGINECHEGDTISYGRSYTVERGHQRIAVIPIGYFDGLHRNYSGRGSVMIRGKRAPMVGKICMDFMMIDITDIPNASIGDSVLIFGEDEFAQYLSPEELALSGDSIIHELMTCLGPRIQRIFIHEEARQFR